jgi:hypothetical protein
LPRRPTDVAEPPLFPALPFATSFIVFAGGSAAKAVLIG